MLLMETISDEQLEQRFAQAAHGRAFGDISALDNLLVNQMMKRHPEYVYSGLMYRCLSLPVEKILECKNVHDLQRYILTKAAEATAKVSWAKDMRGAIRYYNLVTHARRDAKTKYTWNRFIDARKANVIIEQRGVGFDYRPWIDAAEDRIPGMLVSNHQVFEVLSETNQTARIGLIVVNIPGPLKGTKQTPELKRTAFRPSEFNEMRELLTRLTARVYTDMTPDDRHLITPQDKSRYNPDTVATLDPRNTKVGRDYYDK